MPELEQICCQRAQVLMDADSSLDHVFFPDSGVVSAVAVYAATIRSATASICPPKCGGRISRLNTEFCDLIQVLRANGECRLLAHHDMRS